MCGVDVSVECGTLESILDFITCLCYFYGPLLSDDRDSWDNVLTEAGVYCCFSLLPFSSS